MCLRTRTDRARRRQFVHASVYPRWVIFVRMLGCDWLLGLFLCFYWSTHTRAHTHTVVIGCLGCFCFFIGLHKHTHTHTQTSRNGHSTIDMSTQALLECWSVIGCLCSHAHSPDHTLTHPTNHTHAHTHTHTHTQGATAVL